jgi:hypothetical protein
LIYANYWTCLIISIVTFLSSKSFTVTYFSYLRDRYYARAQHTGSKQANNQQVKKNVKPRFLFSGRYTVFLQLVQALYLHLLTGYRIYALRYTATITTTHGNGQWARGGHHFFPLIFMVQPCGTKVGFMAGEVAPGQVFLRVLLFSSFYHCSVLINHRLMRCAMNLTKHHTLTPSVLRWELDLWLGIWLVSE